MLNIYFTSFLFSINWSSYNSAAIFEIAPMIDATAVIIATVSFILIHLQFVN